MHVQCEGRECRLLFSTKNKRLLFNNDNFILFLMVCAAHSLCCTRHAAFLDDGVKTQLKSHAHNLLWVFDLDCCCCCCCLFGECTLVLGKYQQLLMGDKDGYLKQKRNAAIQLHQIVDFS